MKTQIQVQFRQTTWRQARASKPGCRASTVGILTHKNHTGDGTVPAGPTAYPGSPRLPCSAHSLSHSTPTGRPQQEGAESAVVLTAVASLAPGTL